GEERFVLGRQFLPIHPADRIVLAIGVVIALLGPSKLIARQQHGRAQREKEEGDEVPLLLVTQGQDLRVVGRPLDAVVETQIFGLSVLVVLLIGLVVFGVVGNEIGQREAVMRGDEVDRG